GVHVEMEDWTYGSMEIEQDEDFKWSQVNSKEVKIYVKITPTSTKESLEKHKKFLKESHNVDFKYSKLKYRDGKLVSIKIELDDNDGTRISQSYKNDTAIPNICINGTIQGDHKNWKLNNCEEAPPTTYQLGDVKYMNLSPEEYYEISKMNVDSIMQQIELSNVNIDSLINTAQIQFQSINMDSIQGQIQMQFNNMDIDSIQSQIEDSIIHINSNSHIQGMINGYLSSGSYIVMNNSNDENPLVIIDGKESDRSFLNGNMDMSNIDSMNVLKGESATEQYGVKAKDGAVIIITKDGKGLNKLSNTDERRMLLDKKRIEMDSLRSTRRSELELRKQQIMVDRRVRIDSLSSIRRDQAESRRQELLQRRDEKRQEINNRRNSEIREFRFASKPQYNGEYKIMNRVKYHSLDAVKILYTIPGKESEELSIDYYDRIHINVDTPDSQLKAYENRMEKLGIDFEFKTVKRNSIGQLYKLSFNMNGRNYKVSDSDGIEEIIIHINNRDGMITYQ
ncbi:TonB-dependent receptor plug domain-containing protein, partial [Nonlabens mediterrranea]|nr:TonB-dependent receptor plug domain-containing protein [Nonlabens mediterrranea]